MRGTKSGLTSKRCYCAFAEIKMDLRMMNCCHQTVWISTVSNDGLQEAIKEENRLELVNRKGATILYYDARSNIR